MYITCRGLIAWVIISSCGVVLIISLLSANIVLSAKLSKVEGVITEVNDQMHYLRTLFRDRNEEVIYLINKQSKRAQSIEEIYWSHKELENGKR